MLSVRVSDDRSGKRHRVTTPRSSLALAAVFLGLVFAAPHIGPYLADGFLVVMLGVALMAFLYPGHLAGHLATGILPVVALLLVADLTRTVTVHTSTGVWHGPSLVHRALAVVVFFGAPAVVGLLIGDALGRRRTRPAVR